MADDIKLSKVEIEELRSLVRLLKEDMSETEFQNLLKTGPAAKKMLQDLRKESIEFTSDVGGVIQAFNQLMNEIKGTNSGINKVHSAFKGINKLAEEIQYAQRGSISLNEKDLAKLQEKMAIKKIDLENANKLLEIEKNEYEKTRKFNKDQVDFYQKEKEKLDNKTIWTEKDLKRSVDLEKLQKKANERLKETEAKLEDIEKQQGNIAGILSDQDGHYNTLTATLAKLKRQLEDQNKLLGLGGAIIGSLNAALGQLGLGRLAGALGISEASAEMNEFAKQIVKDREKQLILEKEITDEVEARAKGQGTLSPEVLAEKQNQLEALKGQNAQYDGINGKLAVLKKGISSMGASLLKNLTDPVALTVGLVTQLFSALKTSDEATGKLARQFGTSYKEASNLRQELNSMANSSFDLNVTTQGLQESLMAVNQALGTNGKLNEADLVTMTKLTKQAGYTHDELMGIEKLSLSQGKSLDDNVKLTLGSAKAHAAMRGLMVNEREVLKEVNKMSASLKLSLGGNVDKMAEAVVKTKEFGLSIEQAEKMADGLLQFESSISSELEAEMLTGKALNFEKARLLALNNDVAGAAAEIAKQVGTSADFAKMNRIQQEALAKAAGMTRDELAQSLMDREALVALSGVEGKTAKERFDNLVKEVGMEEAKKRLGNDELAKQYESQSIQEKFQATTQKVMDIFVSMAQPILDIVNALTPVFKFIGWIASGIGTIVNLLNKWTFGTLPLLIGGFFTLKLLSGGIGSALLKGLVYPFKAAKEGLSSLGGGLKSMFSEIKEKGVGKAFKDAFTSIKDKIKSKTSDKGKSKVEDLADKAKDKGDKASDGAKGGDNAKGFAERMKNIAKGIKAFADKDVFLGALNLIPASIGLITMLPGVLGAKAIEKLDGKKIKSSLEGLAKGIEAFGSGKITGGAANLIAASVGLTAMIVGTLGAKVTEKIDGKAIKKALEGLADGIKAFANKEITGGSANLIVASIGLTAMIIGTLGAKVIEKIDGKSVKKALEGLADGIKAFANKEITGGSANLIIASVGLTAMIIGTLGAKVIEKIDGKNVKKALEGLADGIKAFANKEITGGSANLIVASVGLTVMIIGTLGAKVIEKIDGKAVKKALEGLSDGIKTFANKEITGGSANLVVASVGLTAMIVGTLGAKVIEKIDGKAVKKALEGLAAGIESFGSGKITGGSANLVVASVGLTAMVIGTLGAKAVEKIDGKAVKKALEGVSEGLETMAKGKVALGALALTTVSAGLTLMIPGVIGAKIIEKIDGKGVKKGLEGLADGLEAMAKGKVLLGAGALAIASVGLTVAIPGMIAAGVLGTMGPLVEKGLKSFASGIERLASGKVLLGALALAALGAALIPAAYALKQFSDVNWSDLGKAGVTLVGLGVAGAVLGNLAGQMILGAIAIAALGASLIPAAYALKMFSDISWEDLGKAGAALVGLGVAGAVLGSFLPLMLMGAIAIAALGASLFPLALALNLAAPALDQFSEALSKIEGEKLFSAAAGIGALGAAMAAFGAGSLISGIGSAIGDFFGGDPTEKFNKLASVDGEKLKVTADSINTLGIAINNLDANKLGEVGDGFEKLSDSLNKSLLSSSIGDLLGAESPVSSMIAQLNELGSFDSTKILTIAEAIAKLSESITNLNSVTANVGDVSPIITTVDKVVELHDSLNKTSLEKVVDKVSEGVSSLFSKAFEFVSSVSSTDKTVSNTESATSASSLSSVASSKSLSDIVNITAKEATLTISDKVILDIINKSKEETSKTVNKNISSSIASSIDKTKSTDKTKEVSDKLKTEISTADKTNQLTNNVDVLKVNSLSVEKQSTEKTKESTLDKASGVIGGAMTGAEIGGLFGPLGMLAGGLIGGAISLFEGSEEEITSTTDKTKSNVSNLNTLASSSVNDINKSTDIANTTNLNAVNALNKTNLTVQAENVTIASSNLKNITSLDKKLNTSTDKTKEELSIIDKSKEINTKLASSDKVKDLEKTKKTVGEIDVNKLKEELLTNEKTNELVSTGIDNLKVTNLITEKQSSEKTKESTLDKASGIIGGAMTGAEIGGLFGPLGMLAGGLIGGAASLFEGNEEEITPINNEIQPLNQTVSSPNSNISSTSTSINNQNIASNDNVVKVLQEAVTILKAIQAKDTTVQLAVDGDVIAKKITPNVSREQVRTYSSIS